MDTTTNHLTLTLPAATLHVTYDLRRGIEEVFASWERRFERSRTHYAAPAFDLTRDQYLLQLVDHTGDKYHSTTLAHLEIRDGKIRILTDNTEEGIGNELVAVGIPKSRIVLAFYPPDIREMGDFAVS